MGMTTHYERKGTTMFEASLLLLVLGMLCGALVTINVYDTIEIIRHRRRRR
jgi:hypothetical protein